jgi:hypothetical protein
MKDTLFPLAGGELVQVAKRQARPRRWPWQPKTLRDHIQDWSADMSELAAAQGEVLLRYVREQSRPRRWPWQPKTLRDHINGRSAELAALAAERSAELADLVARRSAELASPLNERAQKLLKEAQRQARPRRWLWQKKTLRDKLNKQSAKLAAQATKRSAELAAMALARRDQLLKEAQRQAQPRRWPWQQKTARDKLNDRVTQLKTSASDQASLVAGLTNEKLDTAKQRGLEVYQELQHQAQPRRWPWQQKTARDKLNEQVAHLQENASDWQESAKQQFEAAKQAGSHVLSEAQHQAQEQLSAVQSKASDLQSKATNVSSKTLSEIQHQAQPRRWPWQQKTARDKLNDRLAGLQASASDLQSVAQEKLASAQQTGSQVLSELQHQAQPRRWPWQKKTARDKLGDQLTNLQSSAGDVGNKLQHVAALGAGAAAAGVAYAATRGQQVAEQVQHVATSVPDAIGSTASSVGESVKGTAKQVAKRAGKTKQAAKAVVRTPVDALNTRVQYGKLNVNHGVSLVKTAIRWAIIGFVIGILTSPSSGRELRRQIRDTAVRLIDSILKPN